jgi:hypothetical protein
MLTVGISVLQWFWDVGFVTILPSGFLLLGDKDMYPSPSDFE